jgi:uncharacterized protein (DUF433 family)
MLYDFYQSAEFRTADIVPSIRVMLAQLYTLLKLEDFTQYLTEDFSLNRDQLQKIFRYAFEE